MADTVAKLNIAKTWTPANTGDTITCSDISQRSRAGVQIASNGFDLEDATVTVTMSNGASKAVAAPANSGELALFGKDFNGIASIQITGVAAGTHTVTFSQ